MSDRPDPRELADLALEVARAAADLIRERSAQVAVAATKSSITDPVTEVDRASEQLIRDRLLARRPQDGFVGEEGRDVPSGSGVCWIVDPIDGTVNFLYGTGDYAVSIAAEVDGEVCVGVVVDVTRGIEYLGRPDDRGGWLAIADGRPISTRPTVPLGQRLIGTGFSYEAAQRALQGAAVARLLPSVRDIRRRGSAALDLCAVASGQLDGYLEEGIMVWDYAAGALIARAAGARTELVTGAGGRAAMVCAPKEGFDELLWAAQEAGFVTRDTPSVPGE